MFCRNCGNEVPDTMNFCTRCGAKLETAPQGQETYPVEMPGSELEYIDRTIGDRAGYSDEYRTEIVKKPGSGSNTSLIVVTILLSLILVVGIVFGVLFFGGSGDVFKSSEKPTLTVDSYPSQTDKSALTLSGSATTGSEATISINGQYVDTVSSSDGKKNWSKEVTLAKGVNNFDIVVTDNDGNSAEQQISVVYNSTLLYEAGTILVKGDPAAVYVRPTPQKGEKYVILIPREDFTSQFVCVGEESRDSEGYIWCKVQTPSSGIGWIRSDLVKPLQ